MARQITVRPPIAPPITALSFVEVEKGGEAEEDEAEEDETEESEAENGGVVPDGGEVIEEYAVELELDAGKSDVSTTVVVDREAEPSTKLLGTEVELDGAVVVATTVGV